MSATEPVRKLLAHNAVLAIPESVAVCPYCKTKLYAQFEGWEKQDDGTWIADTIALDCETEPDIDSGEWDDWLDSHSDMPYVYMLPIHETVKKWINTHYRFEAD